MTLFRIYYKQRSYLRWCYRTARLRTLPLALPLPQELLLPAAAWPTPGTGSCRHAALVLQPLVPATVVLRVGDFVIGEAGDPQLSGHPDIRY